jgi:hypothetical protein
MCHEIQVGNNYSINHVNCCIKDLTNAYLDLLNEYSYVCDVDVNLARKIVGVMFGGVIIKAKVIDKKFDDGTYIEMMLSQTNQSFSGRCSAYWAAKSFRGIVSEVVHINHHMDSSFVKQLQNLFPELKKMKIKYCVDLVDALMLAVFLNYELSIENLFDLKCENYQHA